MRQYKHTAHGKHRYADGGSVNATQKAVGPTLFQSVERKKRAAADSDTATSSATSTGSFFNGRPKAAPGAEAKLQQLLKKRDDAVE